MEVPISSRYVGAKQAARYLGMSVFSVYRLVERRVIPFIRVHPSAGKVDRPSRPTVRFDLRALDAWMQRQTVKPRVEFVDASHSGD